MSEQLYICKSVDAKRRGGMGNPIYLTAIVKDDESLATHWTAKRDEAMKVTAEERDALLAKGYRGGGFGRWVRA